MTTQSKYLPKNLNIINNERSRIEFEDISTKLLIDLPVSGINNICEIFSASGIFGLLAAKSNPNLQVEEFVTNVQDCETISMNAKNNGITSISVSPTTNINKLDHKVDIIVIKTLLEKRKQYILQTVLNAASFLQDNGLIYLVGAKDEGIQSIAKHLSSLLQCDSETVTFKKGVHLIKIKPTIKNISTDILNLQKEIQETNIRNIKLRLFLNESVFAKGGLDPATQLLAENMIINDNDRVLDLGCGSGILGMIANKLAKNVMVLLTDNDYPTIELCKQNVDLNQLTNCRVLASDGTKNIKNEKFTTIITNPPFHQGRQTTSLIADQFIDESYNALLPKGKLFVVCNIFLPYEKNIQKAFGNYQIIANNKSYKVISAVKH